MDGIRVSATLPPAEGDNFEYLELLARVKTALDSAREISVSSASIRRYKEQPRTFFKDDAIWLLSHSMDSGGQTTSGLVRAKRGTEQYKIFVDKNGKRYSPEDKGFEVVYEKGEGCLVLEGFVGQTDYELIDGERRWRGNLLIPPARRPPYKAKLIDAEDDVIRFLISGVANFNREGHEAHEVLRTITELVGFKIPMREIAKLLGISVFWATQIHGLRNLEPEVLAKLNPELSKEQQLPLTAAIHISKVDKAHQVGLAQRVMSREVRIPRLREEVIRVSKETGTHIRLRSVPPDKKWTSLRNKLDLALRTASDVEHMLSGGEMDQLLKSRPSEVAELQRQLRDGRELLSRIETALLQKRRQ